ncbi:MAG: transporter substrate-binding domain-containing protein [Burkholderiales bacterium]|nr:transporter substrate-binding domain-containing protein [Burkholderiales bacterium]
MIRKESQPLFAKINTLADLKKMMAGQGRGWPDAEILQANGLPLYTSATSPQLQKMLSAGRIDYLPLSILEVWPELQDPQEQQERLAGGIVVEPHLILHYPTAFYFFVQKENQLLAATLEAGLRQAWQDGSADKLFQRFYGSYIERAKIAERTKIALRNPLLPAETPLEFLWTANGVSSVNAAAKK